MNKMQIKTSKSNRRFKNIGIFTVVNTDNNILQGIKLKRYVDQRNTLRTKKIYYVLVCAVILN